MIIVTYIRNKKGKQNIHVEEDRFQATQKELLLLFLF